MEKLLVANYKMNGNKNFYKKVNKVVNKLKVKDTIILCPPFVYMPFFKVKNKNISLGAQDICFENNKKSTGQINGEMLNDFNVSYVLIGHSERRALGETNEIVAKKVSVAHQNRLIPIICVGENEKTSNINVLVDQVQNALNNARNKEIIFAYEPIWAIGTGEQPSVTKINNAIKLIKQTANKCGFKVKVLYGGSVNVENFPKVSKSQADGFLMGGVSNKLEEFLKIIKGE